AILMVIRQEDNVLAFAWPLGAFIHQWRGGRERDKREQGKKDAFHEVGRLLSRQFAARCCDKKDNWQGYLP
ncbi:MAG: hypothetical protein ACK55I_13760, partial [bacterium]